MIEIDRNLPEKELRLFAAVFFPAFWLLIGSMIGRKFGFWPPVWGLWAVVAVVAAIGFIRPRLIRPVYVAMVMAVFPIGWVVSHVILFSTWWLVITPIGLLLRVAGRDPMERTFDGKTATYWKPRGPAREAKSYFRQF